MRTKLDKLAWQTIHSTAPVPGTPAGLQKCGRPCNYIELGELFERTGDFEQAWSEFLHEFFRYKKASFLGYAPPKVFSPEFRAMMAGVAEFLCLEFALEAPAWVANQEFTMPELSEPYGWMYPEDNPGARERRIERTHALILKHNIIFETRNLITL